MVTSSTIERHFFHLIEMRLIPMRELVEKAPQVQLTPILPIPKSVKQILAADPSQKAGLDMALTQRVSIIQGPL
jgi:hypothetical protein